MNASAFGRELRIAREALGWTLDDLAQRVNYSVSLIEKVENGRKLASDEFTKPVVRVIRDGVDVEALLGRLQADSRQVETVPGWLQDWVLYEREASYIRWWEPLVVPSLLQTEGYATALLGDETKVAARMVRQGILSGEEPPEVVVMVDESVLHRQVGSYEVMYDQLSRLANPPTTVRVQVLPIGADTLVGVDGSFIIAMVDVQTYVYVETPVQGLILSTPAVVFEASQRWDALRGEALPARQSKDMILELADRWKNSA